MSHHNPPSSRQRQEDIRRVSESVSTMMQRGEIECGSVAKMTAKLLQISERTVKTYWKRQPEQQVTPGKKRKRIQSVRGDVDDFGREAIKRTLYRMYSKGEHVILDTLLNEVRDDETIGFKGGRTTLYKLLAMLEKLGRKETGELGFSWEKCDNRRALLENVDIITKRISFLREFRNFKERGMRFIFLDETWFYTKGSTRHSWQDNSVLTCKRRTLDKGKRVTVVHAGSQDGFIDGAGLTVFSKKNSQDYHGTMTADMFENWLQEKLLINLEEPSVIVFDNASYHSAQVEGGPTRKWKKEKLQNWLRKRNIDFNRDALCAELYMKAMENKPTKKYRVDEIIYSNGHQVLRLPPYHCHYNSIELVWHELKQYYDNHIGKDNKFDDKAVIATWEEALAQVTSEKWRNYVRHTEDIIGKDWEKEVKYDRDGISQPFIIQVDDIDSEEESDFEDPGDVLAEPLEGRCVEV